MMYLQSNIVIAKTLESTANSDSIGNRLAP